MTGNNGPVTAPFPPVGPARAVADIDLAAFAHNVRALKAQVGRAQLMVVVKADAYGHGAVACARAARRAGADWLGVAFIDEALALRAAGDTGPLLAWLLHPADDLDAAIAADIDISVSSPAQLQALLAAFERAGRQPRLHVEVDTGMARAGVAPEEWAAVFAAAAPHEVVSIWSHLACADEPEHPANTAQAREYHRALEAAHAAGVRPALRHLANSAATLSRTDLHFDLVRVGIAAYGVSPFDAAAGDHGLVPVMTLRTQVSQVRDVPAGTGVSYGHRHVTSHDTRLALLPLGYADGLPRAAGSAAQVALGAHRFTIAGSMCMDQCVIDVGSLPAAVGDDVVVFGVGGPSASEWARACGTIGYEITTRIGTRVARRHIGGE